MRAAQMRGRGAPPGLIETLFNHSRTSSDRKCLFDDDKKIELFRSHLSEN